MLWSLVTPAALAQTPPPKSPSMFALLNLIRSPQPAVLKLGAEPLGEGQMSLGFYTGIVSWQPNLPLVVEASGFSPLRIPPTPSGKGELPLFIVQDALEKPPGGGEPKPILKYITAPSAKDRPACFFDGLNLTSRDVLIAKMEGKDLLLEKGKRVRLSTKNGFRMQLRDGPEISYGPYEENPGGILLVFFETPDSKISHVLTYDR